MNSTQNKFPYFFIGTLFIFLSITTILAQDKPIAGLGAALNFNGSNTYIGIPHNESLSPVKSEWSILAWIKTEKDNSTILKKTSTNTQKDFYGIEIIDGKAVFHFTTGGDENKASAMSTTKISDNRWHHIVGIRSDNSAIIYVDGSMEDSIAKGTAEKTIDVDKELRIGNDSLNNNYFMGTMDEIQIWNIAVSKAQINTLMFLPPKRNEPNLIAYWNFDTGVGTEITDYSNHGNRGTLNGSLDRIKSSVWDTVTINSSRIFTHMAGYNPTDPTNTPITIVEGTVKPSDGTLTLDNSTQTITYTPNSYLVKKDSYSFLVENKDNSSLKSDEYHITVIFNDYALDITKIIEQPLNDTVLAGDSVKFRVLATAQSSRFYQWQKKLKKEDEFSDIVKADTPEYSFIADTSDNGALFRCLVWNTSNPKIEQSDPALLTIGKKPTIVPTFPGDTLIQVGQNISLNASVEGSLPIHYKWFFTSDLKNVKSVGKDTSVFEIKSASKADSGYYYFSASNSLSDQDLNSDTLLVCVKDYAEMISNPLAIAGEYLPDSDSAKLKITHITKLDIKKDKAVIIQCSYASDFNSLLLEDTLIVSDLVKEGKDELIKIIKNLGIPPIETDTVYCQCYILSSTIKESQKNKSHFTVGMDRPEYKGRLKGDSISNSNNVYLHWNKPDTKPDTTPDSIRIWWDTKNQIPLGHELNLPKEQVHYVNAPSDTSDTLSGFKNNTVYYFGLQIFKDNMWSKVTEYSRTYTKTARGDTTDRSKEISNRIAIDSTWFDKVTNSIQMRWHIDLSKYPKGKQYFSGVTYSIGNTLDTTILPVIRDTINLETCTSSVELRSSDIVFDTSYTLGIWIQSHDENNKLSNPGPPTDSSRITIKTPTFTWKEITLFPDPTNKLYLSNKKIILEPINPFRTSVIIRAYELETALPPYLREVGGVAFSFESPTNELPPFRLGMAFSKSDTVKNKAIYQLRNNKFYIIHEFETTDSAIYITVTPNTNMLKDPFFVLEDLSAPSVKEIRGESDSIILVTPNIEVQTKFNVSDNIANVRWQFLYNSGNKTLDYHQKGLLDSTHQVISTLIKDKNSTIIHKNFGVRALFIVSDGIHTDTINVSRCVRAPIGESISIEPGRWIPLSAAAHLDTTNLGAVFTKTMPTWSYDNTKYRIFRWYKVDATNKNNWLEYSDRNKDFFAFQPGQLIWYKTTSDNFIQFGAGITISLRKSYDKLILVGKNWTDISNPFQFDIKLRDILKANKKEVVNNIDICHWKKDGNSYSAEYIFYGRTAAGTIDTLSAVLKSAQGNDGYTIYNYSQVSNNFKIPPVCVPLSPSKVTPKLSKRSESSDKWFIHFRWKKRENSPQSFYKRVRVGYKNDLEKTVEFGPLPPSMSKITVGAYDTSSQALRGWALQNSMKEGGMIFDMAVHNSSSQNEQIEFYLDNLILLPKEVKAAILNPDAVHYEIPKKIDPAGKQFYNDISIPAQSTTHRMLVIGSADYLKYAKQWLTSLAFTFMRAYPNPFIQGIKIHYRIPVGTKEVHFTLYDMMGKQIFKSIEKDFSRPGEHIFYYDRKRNSPKGDKPISSGMYILRLTAINNANSIMYGGEKRVICIN